MTAPVWCLRPGRIIRRCPDGTMAVIMTETADAIIDSIYREEGGMTFARRRMPPFPAGNPAVYIRLWSPAFKKGYRPASCFL